MGGVGYKWRGTNQGGGRSTGGVQGSRRTGEWRSTGGVRYKGLVSSPVNFGRKGRQVDAGAGKKWRGGGVRESTGGVREYRRRTGERSEREGRRGSGAGKPSRGVVAKVNTRRRDQHPRQPLYLHNRRRRRHHQAADTTYIPMLLYISCFTRHKYVSFLIFLLTNSSCALNRSLTTKVNQVSKLNTGNEGNQLNPLIGRLSNTSETG